jgi:hypothetical protein
VNATAALLLVALEQRRLAKAIAKPANLILVFMG